MDIEISSPHFYAYTGADGISIMETCKTKICTGAKLYFIRVNAFSVFFFLHLRVFYATTRTCF